MDPKLKEWATKVQNTYIDAVIETGSLRKASQKLGINERTLTRSMAGLKKRAAQSGYSPPHGMNYPVPDGYSVKGISTLYDQDGAIRAQWVKSRTDDEQRLESLRDSVNAIIEDVRGFIKPTPAPSRTSDRLMTVYPMGDPHIGMYAWAKECEEDFDCDIARANLTEATSRLVACAPPSDTGVIINLGDFFHADNLNNTTMRSGNSLDVDTRWPRVLSIGILTMRDCIDLALKKHKNVRVICAIGNHDDHSSIMLSMCLSAVYEKEPRITVEPTFSRFHYLEFGKSLIGVTHGDTVKMTELGGIMASDKPAEWGRTKHRYWYTGHIHHRKVEELAGCTVESFRTLAAKDSWNTTHGYRAGRDMLCIVHDKEHGEVERHRVDIGMIRT